MRRRLLSSTVGVLGAAALIAGPIVLAAPASAAPIATAVITPDESLPFDPALNHPDWWEQWLSDNDDIDATCIKVEPVAKPYTIPSISDVFEVSESDNAEYVLAVVKGGAGQDPDKDANQIYRYPAAGDQLAHPYYGNSHVILCIADTETETETPPASSPPVTSPPVTSPPVSSPPATGPVVETDRPSSGPGANLGMLAAISLAVAAAGFAIFGRRREGTHR
ncbi:MAG: hypothetical protein ABIQ61_00725 [Ornithinibacter sp.]